MSKEEIKKDLELSKSIEVIAEMEGGLILQKALRQDLFTAIDIIANQYKTLSHPEMIAYGADIKKSLDLLRVFSRAKKNSQILENELEKILKEEVELAS